MSAIPSPNRLKDIVWIQTAFIGDIVLTTGAIELVSRSLPHLRQHVITTSEGAELLKGMPALVTRLTYAKTRTGLKGFLRIKQQLKARELDAASTVILQPHRSVRSSLLSRFLAFPTITYRESGLSFLAAKRVLRVSVFHEVQRIALLLEPLGFKREDLLRVRPRLHALPLLTEIPWQSTLASFKGQVLGLSVGSKWGTKCWPLESYIELAKRLGARPHTRLVLMGSKSEKNLTDAIEAELKAVGLEDVVLNLAGLTSFDDLRRLFPRLDLLVSNDSSPVHFASAFNVKSLVVFGSTTPSLGFGPLAEHSKVVESELPCRPCSDHGPQECPLGHFSCMRKIGVEKMEEEALSLL